MVTLYRKILVFSLILFLIYFTSKESKAKGIEISKARILMGTIVEIKAFGDDRGGVLNAIDRAFSEMERLEMMMSHYRGDSEISLIEKKAPQWVKVSPEVFEVLSEAIKVSKLSEGAFDITVGILGKVWNFEDGKERIPTSKELKALLPFVDYRYIELSPEDFAVRLKKKGVRLTLGGIAKGYIVDRAMDVLKENGIEEALINAGGDIEVMGEGRAWRIGIQHPRQRGSIIGILTVYNGAVATSGDYERFFTKDGVRYHHLLDPRTGMPARGVQSVTIVAPQAWYADALATAVFVMGVEKGRRLIKDLEGVEGVIVDGKGKIWVSSGLKGKLELLR